MSLDVRLINGKGNKYQAKVSQAGELITSPIEYNDTYIQSMTIADQAYNFIIPIAGKRFVLTGLSYSGNKDISTTTGATVIIYEADSPTSLVSTKTRFNFNVGRIDRGSATGLNIALNPGKWLNGQTDSTIVSITLLGYFIDYREVIS